MYFHPVIFHSHYDFLKYEENVKNFRGTKVEKHVDSNYVTAHINR